MMINSLSNKLTELIVFFQLQLIKYQEENCCWCHAIFRLLLFTPKIYLYHSSIASPSRFTTKHFAHDRNVCALQLVPTECFGMSYVLKFNNETKFLVSATFEQLFRFLFMLLRKIDGLEVLVAICKLHGLHVEWIMKFPDTLLMQLFGKIPLLTKSCVDIKRCRVLILVPLIRHTIVMWCRLNELKKSQNKLDIFHFIV